MNLPLQPPTPPPTPPFLSTSPTPEELARHASVQQGLSSGSGPLTLSKPSAASSVARELAKHDSVQSVLSPMLRPKSRAEAVTSMDAKREEIVKLKAKVDRAIAELDQLIGMHNALPEAK